MGKTLLIIYCDEPALSVFFSLSWTPLCVSIVGRLPLNTGLTRLPSQKPVASNWRRFTAEVCSRFSEPLSDCDSAGL